MDFEYGYSEVFRKAASDLAVSLLAFLAFTNPVQIAMFKVRLGEI